MTQALPKSKRTKFTFKLRRGPDLDTCRQYLVPIFEEKKTEHIVLNTLRNI